jgi:hypothetical protein
MIPLDVKNKIVSNIRGMFPGVIPNLNLSAIVGDEATEDSIEQEVMKAVRKTCQLEEES